METLHLLPEAGASVQFCLIAEKVRTRPIMLKNVIDSWCLLNCTGGHHSQIHTPLGYNDIDGQLHLVLESEDDLILFMMSHEFGYMGNPKPISVEK